MSAPYPKLRTYLAITIPSAAGASLGWSDSEKPPSRYLERESCPPVSTLFAPCDFPRIELAYFLPCDFWLLLTAGLARAGLPCFKVLCGFFALMTLLALRTLSSCSRSASTDFPL